MPDPADAEKGRALATLADAPGTPDEPPVPYFATLTPVEHAQAAAITAGIPAMAEAAEHPEFRLALTAFATCPAPF